MTKLMKQLIAGEEGATMTEYALLVALIGAALVTTVTTLSDSIGSTFTSTSNTISAP